MRLGSAVLETPLGCRLAFGFSAATYGLFVFDHHDFISLDLTCRPWDVIRGQPQRLLLASFAHTSLPGLCLAAALSWRRFVWIEHERGTLGFIVWFAWTSFVLHSTFCIFAVCLDALIGYGMRGAEVHGLFPLLIASLVCDRHGSDNAAVWLWPLPVHVSVRTFPLVIIGLCWLFHLQAHSDVVVAYVVALCAPGLVNSEAGAPLLELLEQTPPGCWLASCLERSEAFVCRPPPACPAGSRGGAGVFRAAPSHSLSGRENSCPSTLALERALEKSEDGDEEDDDRRIAGGGVFLAVKV